MSNLSILQRNVIHALDCETSAAAFLRACDRIDVLTAERFALEVRLLVRSLQPMLLAAARRYGLETPPAGLLTFILDRHSNWRLPPKGNRS